MKPAPDENKEAIQQVLEKRWTAPLIKAGYTVLPNVIFLRQQALGLDSIDINILLQIVSYWWDPERLPFPSKGTIAKAIAIDVSTVRKRLAALEKGGLIHRVHRKNKFGGNNTNKYDLSPLIKAATPFAEEMLAQKTQHQQAKLAGLAKKGKPLLKAVK
jgi:predicted transcriptional regulator